MYAPPCSWRTGTNSIDERDSDSFRSSVSSPGIPNTCLTPSASKHSTKTSDALRMAMAKDDTQGPVTSKGAPGGPLREERRLQHRLRRRGGSIARPRLDPTLDLAGRVPLVGDVAAACYAAPDAVRARDHVRQ